MVVIRATQKLLRWLPPAKQVDEPSTTRLGDWYGHLLIFGTTRICLFISERSRLPVLLPGRDLRRVAYDLITGLKEVLSAMQIPTALVQTELAVMDNIQFAPTKNRSLLGTINDFSNLLEWELDQNPRAHLLNLSLKLSESPVKPLGYRSPASLANEILRS